MTLDELIHNLQLIEDEHGNCDIIFESNKHQFENAKVVYRQEINERGDNTECVILSCFSKIK